MQTKQHKPHLLAFKITFGENVFQDIIQNFQFSLILYICSQTWNIKLKTHQGSYHTKELSPNAKPKIN